MAEDDDRLLLLSIRPRYAEAILGGRKSAELRRAVPRVSPGTWALIYSSAPTMAIVGAVRVTDVQADTPHRLWRDAGPHAAVSKPEFDTYFANATRSSALWLSEPLRLDDPVPLGRLRAVADFRPPQSYRYLTPKAATALIDGDQVVLERLGLAPIGLRELAADVQRPTVSGTGVVSRLRLASRRVRGALRRKSSVGRRPSIDIGV
jgi:predicted transcriptional regulator